MRLNWNFARPAVLTVLLLAGAGCSGINTSQSVSPVDFFLPGAGHLLKADPPATNPPATFPEISTQVASAK